MFVDTFLTDEGAKTFARKKCISKKPEQGDMTSIMYQVIIVVTFTNESDGAPKILIVDQ